MSEIKIRVKPDQETVVFTGGTFADAVTGATNIGGGQELFTTKAVQDLQFRTLVAGDNMTVATSGNTIVFSSVGSSTSGVTESEFNSYTGATETRLQGIEGDITAISGDVTTNTSNITTLSGQTASKAEQSDFVSHTGDTSIHYPQSAISITESQISDFGDYVDNTTFTGYTGSTETRLQGIETDITTNQNDIDSLEATVSGLTGTSAVSVATFNGYTGSTQTTLTGLRNDIDTVSGQTANKAEQSDFVSHTGDSSIHYPQSAISITESQISDFGNYVNESDYTGFTASTDSRLTTAESDIDSLESTVSGLTGTSSVSVSTFNGYTGSTETRLQGIEGDITTISGDVSTNTSNITTISGQTANKAEQSDFVSHTGDSSIHYAMSAISITESQISDLGDYVNNTTFTGYTASTDSSISDIQSDISFISGETSTNTSEIADKADKLLTINTITGATTIDDAYNGEAIEADGTFTLTFATGLTQGFQVLITNVGTGTITLAADGTLQTKDSAVTITSQYAGVTAYARTTDTVIAFGDLS